MATNASIKSEAFSGYADSYARIEYSLFKHFLLVDEALNEVSTRLACV